MRKLSEKWPILDQLKFKDVFQKVRKFLREAEENGETGDSNSKGGGPADDKCFLCLKVKPESFPGKV